MGPSRTSTLVGLTIEPGLIAAARVSVNGSILIEGGGCAELEAGVVRDGEVADAEALTECLRTLWGEHKELDKKVRIGVANHRIVVRTLLLPSIQDPKQLATAVRFHAAEEIAMPLKDAVLDFHAVGVVETPDGPRQRIVLVAARRDMIDAILTAVRAAGLKPAGIDLSAFAMIRALQRQRGESDGPELFASVGGLTNLAIAERGICAFTRVAATGLESLASELAERCELTIAQARGWMQVVGLEVDTARIAGDEPIIAETRAVLGGGVRRIAAEMRASLDFHRDRLEHGTEIQRVVLTGAAVAVAGFAPALAAELGLEVQVRTVASASTADVLDPLQAARMSVAAGLAVDDWPPQ